PNLAVTLRQFGEARLQIRESFDGGKAGLFCNARVRGTAAGTIPLFLFGIARGQKQNFLWSFPAFVGGAGGNEQKRGAFLVVAGQVAKIRFLQEDVRGRRILATGEPEKQHRSIELRDETRSAVGVDAI